MKWLLRAVTSALVLCLAVLGALIYRLETAPATVVAGDGPSDVAIGKFSPLTEPLPAPALHFTDRSGKDVSLADFRGKFLLVNLWATWCAPCLEEMPSLERLQAKLGGVTILAVSEDRRGAELVDPFVAKHGLEKLAIYLDPKNEAPRALKVGGLPTSYLIDRDGRILGDLAGAAEWDSDKMVKLLESYLGP
jgi:thiol-disulfide isomerase/thioredoxin